MTPAARFASAATILDQILTGVAAEKALTSWARGSRFAGSGDRAAIRNIVYDSLRRKGSRARLAGYDGADDPGLTGRGLVIGGLREAGIDLDEVFSGQGHAAAVLTTAEHERLAAVAATDSEAEDDLPAWLQPQLRASLGDRYDGYVAMMRQRAPVWLRVNTLKGDAATALAALAAEDILAEATPYCATALRVVSGERKVANSAAYKDGLVELQDISPQRAVMEMGDLAGLSVLDFCAGGGGKALAIAARSARAVTAHDINARRMLDLPVRAKRAGASITVTDALPQTRFDLVLVDVPCSGSGSWARDPDARWRLDAKGLEDLQAVQAGILDQASAFVADGGRLVYMTCSVLQAENEDAVAAFGKRSGWQLIRQENYGPPDIGDGFYMAELSTARVTD